MKLLAALVVVASALAASSAHADCNDFKWSVSKELSWFSGNAASIAAESELPSPNGGYLVTLNKLDATKFAIPPERAPAANSFAAVLKLPNIEKPGLFQITISDGAWIDVIQNGKAVRSSDFSGHKNCPSVSKTVRFPLERGNAIIQLSNSQRDSLKIGVSRVE